MKCLIIPIIALAGLVASGASVLAQSAETTAPAGPLKVGMTVSVLEQGDYYDLQVLEGVELPYRVTAIATPTPGFRYIVLSAVKGIDLWIPEFRIRSVKVMQPGAAAGQPTLIVPAAPPKTNP